MAAIHADGVLGTGAMSTPAAPTYTAPAMRSVSRLRLHTIEDAAMATALGAMVALPLADMLLRRTLGAGLAGASQVVQHLALIVGMLGGAIAAREGRLLALSTLAETMCRGRVQLAAHLLTAAVGASVSIFLAVAGIHLVQVAREVHTTLAYDVPVWTLQLALPIGFGAIAIRQVSNAPGGWIGRAIVAVLAASMVAATAVVPGASISLFVSAIAILVGAIVLGAPAFVALGVIRHGPRPLDSDPAHIVTPGSGPSHLGA